MNIRFPRISKRGREDRQASSAAIENIVVVLQETIHLTIILVAIRGGRYRGKGDMHTGRARLVQLHLTLPMIPA